MSYGRILRNGLWTENVVFSQLLALCPLLAVTGTATNGLGLGIATTAVLVGANLLISLLRGLISSQVRIPVFVMLIASLVTMLDMLMNAWLHQLHQVLGLFIPLIVTNCAILGRAEAFASRRPVPEAVLDGLAMGAGFTALLLAMGAVREVLAGGTLFVNAAGLLGSGFSFLETTVIPHFQGALLMALPPGGFLVLGFLMAGKRVLDRRAQQRALAREAAESATAS